MYSFLSHILDCFELVKTQIISFHYKKTLNLPHSFSDFMQFCIKFLLVSLAALE